MTSTTDDGLKVLQKVAEPTAQEQLATVRAAAAPLNATIKLLEELVELEKENKKLGEEILKFKNTLHNFSIPLIVHSVLTPFSIPAIFEFHGLWPVKSVAAAALFLVLMIIKTFIAPSPKWGEDALYFTIAILLGVAIGLFFWLDPTSFHESMTFVSSAWKYVTSSVAFCMDFVCGVGTFVTNSARTFVDEIAAWTSQNMVDCRAPDSLFFKLEDNCTYYNLLVILLLMMVCAIVAMLVSVIRRCCGRTESKPTVAKPAAVQEANTKQTAPAVEKTESAAVQEAMTKQAAPAVEQAEQAAVQEAKTEQAAPAAEQAAPAAEQAAPAAEQAAPTAEQAAPTAEQAAPTAEQAAPTAEQAAPASVQDKMQDKIRHYVETTTLDDECKNGWLKLGDLIQHGEQVPRKHIMKLKSSTCLAVFRALMNMDKDQSVFC